MTTVNEKSTLIIIPAPVDEAGVALTIGQLTSPTWTLTTSLGAVINSRQNVALAALYIVLTGDDTAIINSDLDRVLTIEAQYDSATYGNGLHLKAEYEFSINDMVKVT